VPDMDCGHPSDCAPLEQIQPGLFAKGECEWCEEIAALAPGEA